jgi:hypothetical protein
MSKVAEQFATYFDAALKSKSEAPYNQLNKFVIDLKSLDDVDACLNKYLDIYSRYKKNDPRSEIIFSMLAERRIKMTKADEDFVDRVYEEFYGYRKTLSPVTARIKELESDRFRSDIVKELKTARDSRQRSLSLVDTLRQMFLKDNNRRAQSIEELYAYDPLPDEKLHKEYQKVFDACTNAWRQAEIKFTDRSYAYDERTKASEEERLKYAGYKGFELRLEEFNAFLKEKRKNDQELYQMLKWARDVVRPPVKVTSSGMRYKAAGAIHIEYELYLHIVFAIYLNAIQEKHFIRNPEGFTAEEKTFFLDPLKAATYYSNFINRMKIVFPDSKPSNASAFDKFAKVYSQLILYARSQHLDLASDDEALAIQKKILHTPGPELANQSFSTKGYSSWAYAQDTFKIGARIGTEISIAYFEGSHPQAIYLELDNFEGFLFRADLSSFTRKVEIGLYQLLWEYNKGLIPLIQKFFEIIGYLPVLVEAGFVGLVEQVVSDQLTGAALEEFSAGFGVDLSSLGMILPLLPGHKLGGSKTEALAEATTTGKINKALTADEITANKMLSSMTSDDAKALNKLLPDNKRALKAQEAYLAQQDMRMAKLAEQRLSAQEAKMVEAQLLEAKAAQQGKAQVMAQGEQRTAVTQGQGALDTRATTTQSKGAQGDNRLTTNSSSETHQTSGQKGGKSTTSTRPIGRNPPPEDIGEGLIQKTGAVVEEEEIRKHIIGQLAEKVQMNKADATEFLGIHEPVTVGTKKVGGKNSFKDMVEKLEDASKLRVERRKKEVKLNKKIADEGCSHFIFRKENVELKAEYDKLKKLAAGGQVKEYEHLNLSPKRIRQIREELEALEARQIGNLRSDITEIWFRSKKVEIADISLRESDPMHLFKTFMYKRIMEEMLPGFKVFAFDIKPKPGGGYIFTPVHQ